MGPAPLEREGSFRMSINPARHTRLVKEALALPSMLGVYVLVWGGWRRGKQFQKRWHLLEEWAAEKPETELY